MESEKALPHLKSIGFQWGEKEPLVTFVYISIIFWLYSYSSFNYYYGKVHVITIFIHTHNMAMVLGNKLPRPWRVWCCCIWGWAQSPSLLYVMASTFSNKRINYFSDTFPIHTSSSFWWPRFFSDHIFALWRPQLHRQALDVKIRHSFGGYGKVFFK